VCVEIIAKNSSKLMKQKTAYPRSYMVIKWNISHRHTQNRELHIYTAGDNTAKKTS
jgi:hypothetical protein